MTDTQRTWLIVLWMFGGVALGHFAGPMVYDIGGEGGTVLAGLLYFALLPMTASWLDTL